MFRNLQERTDRQVEAVSPFDTMIRAIGVDKGVTHFAHRPKEEETGSFVPFIVLIERRIWRPVSMLLLAAVVLVTGLEGGHAGSHGHPRK